MMDGIAHIGFQAIHLLATWDLFAGAIQSILTIDCNSIPMAFGAAARIMSPYELAAAYSLCIALAALAGGWVPLLVRLTHTRMQVALSFVAGVILGIGLLHLIPHGYMQLHNIDQTVWWTMGGFLAMFFLERFFHFHQHDAPVELRHDHHHNHGEHHNHVHDLPKVTLRSSFSWSGALVGMAVHSLIDGIAVAAAIQAEAHEGHGIELAGFGTFLAVALHKPFDSLTIVTLMSASGWSYKWRHLINLLYALIAPLGVLAFFVGFQSIEGRYPAAIGMALCFAGGAFLCIATSDLLPEVQFHSHDRIKLSLALLLGVGLAAAIVLVESSGHEHLQRQAPAVAIPPGEAGG
jgi:zinc and cadmium transporter